MATYPQWRTAADRGEVRRITYVYGDQRVLAAEVIDTVRTLVNPGELDLVTIEAKAGGTAIWDAAHQYPLTADAPRLILVRDAHNLPTSAWGGLTSWLETTRRLPGVHLLFDHREAEVKKAAHIETLKAKPRLVQFVQCRALNSDDAIAWVRRRARLDATTAWHLLERLGGDLAAAQAVCAKLALFDKAPHTGVIDALCDEVPGRSFVDELVAGNKTRALHSLTGMSTGDRIGAIGALSRELEQLALLRKALMVEERPRAVPGVHPFAIARLRPYAKHYDPKRVAYLHKLLAVVDDAHRCGARDGVVEALVCLW